MCVEWTNEWEMALEDITAYKVVVPRDDHFISPLPVAKRSSQSPTGEVGAVLEYRPGSEISSDYPGIYLIANHHNIIEPQVLLAVTIPKGVMFRRGKVHWKDGDGHNIEVRTINALRIKVGELSPPREGYAPWYVSTAAMTSSTATWNYITSATSTSTSTVTWTV